MNSRLPSHMQVISLVLYMTLFHLESRLVARIHVSFQSTCMATVNEKANVFLWQ